MAFDIFNSLDALPSREIRQAITGTLHGIRQIDDFLVETEDSQTEEGGFIPGIINGIFRFGKMLFGDVFRRLGGFLEWSLSSLWGAVVSATQTLWNFNWNITDAELQNQIDSANVALANTLGESLGTVSGQLVCGALPGSLLLKFNQSLGLYALKNVGEEILDELSANLATLVTLTGQQLGRVTFSFLFRKIRDTFFPDRKESEPWSFALAWDNFLESIDSETVKGFIESLFEGTTEACADIGYILWGGVDNWLVENRLQASPLGTEGLVELRLNKNVPDTDSSIRNRQLVYGPSALIGFEAVNRIEADRQLQEVRQFRTAEEERTTYRQKGQVRILFSRPNVPPGEKQYSTEIRFRTAEDIDKLPPSVSRKYAERTRDEFAKPPLVYRKGTFDIKYSDRLNGISDRRYLVLNETEGRKIITALARSATGRAPNWAFAKFGKNLNPSEAYDQTPPNEIIAGKSYPGVIKGAEHELVPRAALLVCGNRVVFTLWDLTGKFPRDEHTIDV